MTRRLHLQLVWIGLKLALVLLLGDTMTSLVIYQNF